MDEMKGVAIAINALGERIDSLEYELRMAKWSANDLKEENKKLKVKLDELKRYADELDTTEDEE